MDPAPCPPGPVETLAATSWVAGLADLVCVARHDLRESPCPG